MVMTTQVGRVAQSVSTLRRSWRSQPILLLDVSASMAYGSPRRIDVLWKAVQALRTPQAPWRVAIFSRYCRWVDLREIPEPHGNTNLADAFVEVGKVAPSSITLVTDGEPDDTAAAHAAGLALRCPINILFAGDPHDTHAVTFCRTLCEATKGTFAMEVLTLASLSTVTSTMRKMLGAGAPTSIPLGGAAS
jgi:hypothetical protein